MSGPSTPGPSTARPRTAGPRTARPDARALARRVWRSLRWYAEGVLGGSKYQGYLAWHARHGHGEPLTEKQYWRHRTEHEEQHPEGRCC